MNGHRINMLPLGAVVIVLILGSPPIAGPVQAGMILVTGSPEKDSVSVNESFSVEFTADIEENILGFGVDLVFDSDLLAVSGYEIAAPFLPLRSRDGDGLAALAYPRDVTGRNVPLLTVTFLPLAAGTAEIAVDRSRHGRPPKGTASGPDYCTPRPAVASAPLPKRKPPEVQGRFSFHFLPKLQQ